MRQSILGAACAAALMIAPATSVAASQSQYVALAYSPLKVGTVYWGFNSTLSAAEATVLKLCQRHEKGCKGSVWVQNGWVSYASVQGPRGGVGFAYGSSAEFVKSVAMHWCLATQNSSRGMGTCGVVVTLSTTPLNTRKVRGGTW